MVSYILLPNYHLYNHDNEEVRNKIHFTESDLNTDIQQIIKHVGNEHANDSQIPFDNTSTTISNILFNAALRSLTQCKRKSKKIQYNKFIKK